MSTSWNKVFEKFLALIDDRELCALLNDEDMTELLSLFLNGAKSVYFKKCEKDLTDIIEPEFFRQSFTGNGTNNDFTITQGISEFNSDSVEMYCSVDNVVLNSDEYTYTEATKTFNIPDDPTNGAMVVCGYNYIGEFSQDLTDEELWILAWGMISVWNSSKLFSAEKMKERLSSKDWNSPHSPANLLDKLLLLRKQSLKEIKTLTVSYTFNGFSGFN